jgi:formylglycine-generating enzyme required for sulfatase activity
MSGDGKWKHADLAGNMFEWTRDTWDVNFPPVPCINCATLGDGPWVIRGGSWFGSGSNLQNDLRFPSEADRGFDVGFRCAWN